MLKLWMFILYFLINLGLALIGGAMLFFRENFDGLSYKELAEKGGKVKALCVIFCIMSVVFLVGLPLMIRQYIRAVAYNRGI